MGEKEGWGVCGGGKLEQRDREVQRGYEGTLALRRLGEEGLGKKKTKAKESMYLGEKEDNRWIIRIGTQKHSYPPGRLLFITTSTRYPMKQRRFVAFPRGR